MLKRPGLRLDAAGGRRILHTVRERSVFARDRQRGAVNLRPGLRGNILQQSHDRLRSHQIATRKPRTVGEVRIPSLDTSGFEKLLRKLQRRFHAGG